MPDISADPMSATPEDSAGAAATKRRVFDHEKLLVYQKAAEFCRIVEAISCRLPRERYAVRDQIERAALSITNNIAEGAEEFSPREKARIYRIAKRSASECAHLLRPLGAYSPAATPHKMDTARQLLIEITAMLTGLIFTMERRAKK